MQKYWDLVLGETLFKTRETLDAERAAVLQAIEQQKRERAGLDLLDADKAAAAAAEEEEESE